MRSLISYQRAQEEQADRAGVKFLTATGQSAKGMVDTFKRFSNESLFAAHGADPYLQSHPMPADRVAALEEVAQASPYWDKKDDPPCRCATTWCAPRSPPSWNGRIPSTTAIRCRTTACRRATRARSSPICTATCATRLPRSTG